MSAADFNKEEFGLAAQRLTGQPVPTNITQHLAMVADALDAVPRRCIEVTDGLVDAVESAAIGGYVKGGHDEAVAHIRAVLEAAVLK